MDITDKELADIGRSAAASVADFGKMDAVEVAGGQDSSQAYTYVFSFIVEQGLVKPGLVEPGQDRSLAGQAYIRLAQAIRDGLMAHGDDHYPIIRLFGAEDWEQRKRA